MSHFCFLFYFSIFKNNFTDLLFEQVITSSRTSRCRRAKRTPGAAGSADAAHMSEPAGRSARTPRPRPPSANLAAHRHPRSDAAAEQAVRTRGGGPPGSCRKPPLQGSPGAGGWGAGGWGPREVPRLARLEAPFSFLPVICLPTPECLTHAHSPTGTS